MKKGLIIGVMVALLSVSVNFVNATSWYYVGRDTTGVTSFIDNSRVIKNSNAAEIFVKFIQPDGSFFIEKALVNRYDKTWTRLSIISYDTDGNIDFESSVRTMPTEIYPETTAEYILSLIW